MLDAEALSNELLVELDAITAEVSNRLSGQNLPFVADQVLGDANKLLGAITDLQKAIEEALLEQKELEPEEVIEIFNSIQINGNAMPITAKEAGPDKVALFVQLEDLLSFANMTLDSGASLGLSGDVFNVQGEVAADITMGINLAFLLDTSTGEVEFTPDESAQEVTLTIGGEINYDLEADNALGFIDISLSDLEPFDPEAPKDDLELELGLDLVSGGGSPTVSMNGRATLDFEFMAGAPDLRVLPEFGANVFVEVTYSDADLSGGAPAEGSFAIELRNVVFKLEALAGVLQDVFSTVSDILNTFPIGEIVDLLVKRLPVVDDLAPNSFDFDSDGKITLQDVITFFSVFSPDGPPPAFGLIQGVILLAEVIDAVDELAKGLAEDGCFDIGTLRLTSDALDTITSGASFGESASLISSGDSDLANLADLIEAFEALHEYIGLDDAETSSSSEVPITTLAAELVESQNEGGPFDLPDVGLSFPFLESPEALVQSLGSLILNGAGAPPVSLVEFDIPALEFNVYDEISIRFGPFIGYLFGTFYAGVDINIGYDTAGFGETFDFLDGLYISPDLPDVTIDGETKTPVGSVALGVGVGGGLDVVIARVSIEGGLLGQIDVFLGGTGPGDNKARLSELGGCFFNDISGRITAGIDLVFKFGFGIFSFTKKQSLATVTLAQFNIDPCNPVPEEIMDELEVSNAALAEDLGDGTLILNVGDRAGQRNLSEEADGVFNDAGEFQRPQDEETFFVGLVPEDEDNPAGAGEVAVFAFGIFQRFGGGTVPLDKIVAAGGSEDDTLTVSAAITLDADLRGNDGDDILIGGAGDDLLRGDNGNDDLDGDLGDDDLFGGNGNDILRGGLGADDIDGGADFDQVDFSQSAQGVMLIESASTPGPMIGIGGEAQGDTVRNVEHFIGSNFDDTFFGNRTQANVFESGAGNDVLIGGSAGDLFIGGLGADVLQGNRAGVPDTPGDAASYVFSNSGVLINLNFGVGVGGEAQGDVFIGIEDFQLSRHGDRFIGDAADNLVDGYDGDDELEGGIGQDTINGGVGDDIVYALADGDTLDGGGYLNYRPDTDELSYEKVNESVFASLLDGIAYRFTTPLIQDQIRFAEYIVFNQNGENSIQRRDSSDPLRISSFENLTGTSFNDALLGDDRANEIRGGLGDDNIDGDGGNDLLIGGGGADLLTGGVGNDTGDYRDSQTGVQANLTAGVVGVGGDAEGDRFVDVENLIGSAYTDTLTGNEADNRLDPFANAFNGLEALIGNDGIDTAVLNYADNGINASFGALLLQTGSGFVQQQNAGGASAFNVASLNTIEQLEFFSGNGDDSVLTQIENGNDIINTGGGDDTIFSFDGMDVVFAGAGDDNVVRIGAGSVINNEYVGAGDSLREAFLLDGGSGIDSLLIDVSYTNQSILWVGGTPNVESNRSITLEGGGVIRNFEILTGLITGDGNDIVGQDGNFDNQFSTGGGSDLVTVGLGFDSADGGEDSRLLPTVPAFAEVDTLIVDYSGQNGRVVDVDPLEGIDALYEGVIRLEIRDFGNDQTSAQPGAIAQVRHKNFERIFLTGTSNDDHLVGADSSYNQTSGPTPGDNLDGGDGNDLIEGLAGDDTLRGGEGIDRLEGGAGDDILIGGARGGPLDDRDVLIGGTGADLFVIGDELGLLYDGQEDSATILDFNPTEGDRIQLPGSPDDYAMVVGDPLVFSNRVMIPIQVFEVDPNTGDQRLVLSFLSTEEIGLTDASIEYIAPPTFTGDGVIEDVPLTVSDEIAESPELTSWLWQAGAIDDETLMSSLQGEVETSQDEEILFEASSASASSTINSGNILLAATNLIDEAIEDFSVPFIEFDDFAIYSSVQVTGDAAATGTFTDMFGLQSGIVLSTGRVDEILGENTEDGRFVQGPRPSTEVVLDFQPVGTLTGGQLYRALVPDIPGGIESLVLQDDSDFLGGLGGYFSAFDLDALFFSQELITTTSGIDRDFVNNMSRVDAIDYSLAGISFEPGYQRPDPLRDEELIGTTNGLIDFDRVRLDLIDREGPTDFTATGFMSLGEGGSVVLDLTAPITSTADAPTYLYLFEVGAPEELDGVGRVSAEPIGVQGDLSTDLGAPGVAGDSTKLTATFFVDYGGKQGPIPEFAQFTNVPFFDLVIVSEELPERGGADQPDLVTVKINGLDVLLDGEGAAVTMNTLALSPYGDYAPELNLNLVGEGALINHLRADSYTTTYRISGPIVSGENTIEIEVADVADALLDTAIFLAPVSGAGPLNTDPVARNDAMVLDQEQSGTINLITGAGIDTDSDGDTLVVTALDLVDGTGTPLQSISLAGDTVLSNGLGTVTAQADGTFTFAASSASRQLAADAVEGLSFAYAISDGSGGTDTANVTVALRGLNDDPVAKGLKRTIDEDTPLTIDLNTFASDIDGDALTFAANGAERGTVDVTDGVLVYTPDTNEVGTDTVTYIVSDGNGGVDTANIAITITPVNDAPIVKNEKAKTDEDTSLTLRIGDLLANDSDPEGDPLKIVEFGAKNGIVKLIEPRGAESEDDFLLEYTPFNNFNGSDTLSYFVSDTNGGVSLGEVLVLVAPVNDAPVAKDDEANVDADDFVVIDVFANDFDPDGPNNFITGPTNVTAGLVTNNSNGTFTFDPNGEFDLLPVGETAQVTFDYRYFDGLVGDTATVTVTVNGTFVGGPITGTPGPDTLNGTALDDIIVGLGGDDIMNGLSGNDLLQGNAGKDEQDGGQGNDRLEGGLDNDILFGDVGEDILLGQGGDDFLNGGGDFDFASFEGSAARVVASINTGVATGEGTDSLLNIEGLIGSAFNDRLTGDATANILYGRAGDDIITGLGGPDELYGEEGNDTLIGSGGNDILYGGIGNDTLDGLGGADMLFGEEGNDTLIGNVGVDTIDGGSGADDVFGNFGADVISGGADNDNIRAGGSGDVVSGGDGNDRIVGGNGKDTIWGGRNNDVLFGGEGHANGDNLRDVFVFKSAANGGGGFDIIRDFENNVDKLDLSESGYTTFADVLADATEIGGNLEINFDFSGLLRINNFSLAEFNSGDVLF